MTDSPDVLLESYRADPHAADVALLRHLAAALASGAVNVPVSESAEILAQAVAIGVRDREIARQLSSSGASTPTWMPHPPSGNLHWTVLAALEGRSLLTLDSPSVVAWFLAVDDRIDEVIIIGRGTPRLQAKLNELAMNAALALPRDTSALLLDGLIWITGDIYADFFEPGPSRWNAEDKELAADAFALLKIEFEALQQESALVEVFSASNSARVKSELLGNLRPLEARARSESRDMILRGPREDPIAAVVPIRTRRMPLPFGVPFAAALLSTPEFDLLYSRALEDSLERTRAHAQRRLTFYREHFEQHTRQHDYYRALPPAERSRLDKDNVVVNQEINFETATTIMMTVAREISGHEYYNQNLPALVAQDKLWLERMNRVIHSIERNLDENKSGTKRLIAARLIDMVIRDLSPSNPELREPFRAFQRMARPYLLHRVRSACEHAHVDPARLRGRRLVFGLRIDTRESSIRPYWVWTSSTGVIDLPASGDIARVIDHSDGVSNRREGPSTVPARTVQDLVGEPSQQAIETALKALMLLNPVQTALDFVETSHSLFYSRSSVDTVDLRALNAFDILEDVNALMAAGALGPALRTVIEAAAVAPDRQVDVLPELILQLLQLAAVAYPQDTNDVWETLKRWTQGSIDFDVRSLVKQSVDLLNRMEPGYLELCIAEKRVATSAQMSQLLETLKRDPSKQAQRRRRRASRAISTCLALRKYVEKRGELPTGRVLYKRLAPALLNAVRLNLGNVYDARISDFLDLVVGAQHQNRTQGPHHGR
jgi:hypothetical protein